jgi:hypothetical protein
MFELLTAMRVWRTSGYYAYAAEQAIAGLENDTRSLLVPSNKDPAEHRTMSVLRSREGSWLAYIDTYVDRQSVPARNIVAMAVKVDEPELIAKALRRFKQQFGQFLPGSRNSHSLATVESNAV